jgi:cell shape-determining protein MreD
MLFYVTLYFTIGALVAAFFKTPLHPDHDDWINFVLATLIKAVLWPLLFLVVFVYLHDLFTDKPAK